MSTPQTTTVSLPTQQQKAPATSTDPHAPLRDLGDIVHLPGDPGYDDARRPWNVAFDQRPAAVVFPRSTAEVSRVVRAAAACGLRVAPQGTGHNPGALPDLSDVVLLRTAHMCAVSVDPERRRVRVQAGALWEDAVTAAAAHGLAVLHGSSPDVGVVGYCLGGGIGWLARSHGLAAHAITGAQVVLADGSTIDATPEQNTEVLWALRGGGGNAGIVTELEIEAYDIATVVAGMLVWDWDRAAEVLPVWTEWARSAPDEVTTSFRLLQLPPIPEIPEPFRGRNLVVIDGAVQGTDMAATGLLAPLRALQPELDTFARVPAAGLVRLHMDPEGPTPAMSETLLLEDLPQQGIDAFLAAAGPGSGSMLLSAEIRQLGGALGRPQPYTSALSHLPGQFLAFGVGMAITPEMGAATLASAQRLVDALQPWGNGSTYLNFVERSVDASTGYSRGSLHRLLRLRSALDPTGRILANHPVPHEAG